MKPDGGSPLDHPELIAPERWDAIKQIVGDCLALPPDQRESRIHTLCGGDAELVTEVQSLVRSHAEMGDFLAASVFAPQDGELLTGCQVGHYQLCEPIAEGGMGTVYRAVRSSDFEKQVAIKLVKRGMDTDFILRRFRHERQILAGLDHTNIARLLDGGATEDGRPYLVMEYIEGTPITDYAEQRGLNARERLELFRKVCSAVQYAHQNLVVHRDLKPSNILVTAEGAPKLLDFGIAKLLEPDADATITSVRLMTPECASPEQVCGRPATTASDVYALGVLLYHLLTGETPYRFTTRTPQEIAQVVCETEPKRPSAVKPLSQDLDIIILKAMHKEPARRYVSAEQLAEDIRRYLEGLPIAARKDTFRYRGGKFVGRHKAATAAAALVALSLTGGMAATLWEAHVAQMERARAERRFNDVRDLANSLMFEVHDAIQTLPGSTAARRLIVDRALKYLNRLAEQTGNENSLRREVAAAYLKLGQVQGESGFSNLGDTPAATESFRKAVKLLEDVVATEASSIPDRRALANGYDKLATALWEGGDRREAEDLDDRALRIRQAFAGHLPEVETSKELLSSYYNLGVHRTQLGDLAGALENYKKCLDACEKIARSEPARRNNLRTLSIVHKRIGAVLIRKAELADALDHYRSAQTIDEKRIADNPNNAVAQMDVTYAYSDIGYILRNQGDLPAALANYRKAEKVRTALVAADQRDQRARSGLASAYSNIGLILWAMGDRQGALASHQKALQIRELLLAENPVNRGQQEDVAATCLDLGTGYAQFAAKSSRPEDGLALWRKARSYFQRAARMIANLKGAGGLVDEVASRMDRDIAQGLLKCDASITKLTAALSP
jgi:tetratricopeptide (TPR) repeat protein